MPIYSFTLTKQQPMTPNPLNRMTKTFLTALWLGLLTASHEANSQSISAPESLKTIVPQPSPAQQKLLAAQLRQKTAAQWFNQALDIIEQSKTIISAAQSPADALLQKELATNGLGNYFDRIRSRPYSGSSGGYYFFAMSNAHCHALLEELGWLRAAIQNSSNAHIARFAKGEKPQLLQELSTLQAQLQSISAACIAESAHYIDDGDRDHVIGTVLPGAAPQSQNKDTNHLLAVSLKTATRTQAAWLYGVKKPLGFESDAHWLNAATLFLSRHCSDNLSAKISMYSNSTWGSARTNWSSPDTRVYGRLACHDIDMQQRLLSAGLVDIDYAASGFDIQKLPHYAQSLRDAKTQQIGVWSQQPNQALAQLFQTMKRVKTNDEKHNASTMQPRFDAHAACGNEASPWYLTILHAGGVTPFLTNSTPPVQVSAPRLARNHAGLLCLPKDFERNALYETPVLSATGPAGLALFGTSERSFKGVAQWDCCTTPSVKEMISGKLSANRVSFTSQNSAGTQQFRGAYLPARGAGSLPRMAGKLCLSEVLKLHAAGPSAYGLLDSVYIEQHYFYAEKLPLIGEVAFEFVNTLASKQPAIALPFPTRELAPAAWEDACPAFEPRRPAHTAPPIDKAQPTLLISN